MKAILWKELRENLRWAALGCLVLVLAEFYILAGLQKDFQSSNNSNVTLTHPTFLMVVLFGGALVAGGLAAVQILPERSRDRWAALLHRPVSRGVIFRGKAAAGLGLYAAAAGLPFLASACYVAWPGKFPAPFVAGLLLPGVHALAGGVGFYFGSLLLCLHQGRWLGTRGALLLALGAVFLLQVDAHGPFLRLPSITAAVLFLAAWHAMLGEDANPRGRWLRRGAFVAVVLLGAQLGLLLMGQGLSLVPKPEGAPGASYTQLEVTPEGQVLKARSSLNGDALVVTDLAGNPVTDERYLGNNNNQNTCRFWPLSYSLGWHRSGAFLAARNSLRGVSHVQGIRLGNEARESWFHLVRQHYFIGYDNLSRRCVGICDREGFKAPGAKPVPFTGELQEAFFTNGTTAWFWTGGRLYAISFFDRQSKIFFDRPGGAIDDMLQLPMDRSSEDFRYIVLALENGIQVLDEQGRTVFIRPYLHDLRRWDAVEVATNPAMDRLYVQSQPGFYHTDAKQSRLPTYLDELDLHGNVLRSYDQPIDNTVPPDARWLGTARACLLPLAPAVLEHLSSRESFSFPGDTFFSLTRDVSALDPAGWTAIALLAVALALAAFVWARRAGFAPGRAGGWAVFVLAFGPAGLLAFRLAGGWPPRVRCPSCGHLRSLRQDTCPHCQSLWEAPQPTGTEIFQPLAAQG